METGRKGSGCIENLKTKLIIAGIIVFLVMCVSGLIGVFKQSPRTRVNPVDIELITYKTDEKGKRVDQKENSEVGPGQEIPFVAKVRNNGVDCYLRLKITYVNENTSIEKYAVNFSNKFKKHGDYYYYDGIFKQDERIDVFDLIIIPEDVKDRIKNNEIKLEIGAQAIQAKDFEPDFSLKDPWKQILPEANVGKIYYMTDDKELNQFYSVDQKETIDLPLIIFILSAFSLVSIMIIYSREKKKEEKDGENNKKI